MLTPEFQNKIDAAMKDAELSDERIQILQPLIEKSIQFSKADDGKTIKLNIVDAEGKIRDISLAALVLETHKAVANDAIPTVSSREKLTNEQLKKVAEGKLGIKFEQEKVDPDAIKGSEILNKNISLESIASGKVRVDINS